MKNDNLLENFVTEVVPFDEEKAKQNLIDNDFSKQEFAQEIREEGTNE